MTQKSKSSLSEKLSENNSKPVVAESSVFVILSAKAGIVLLINTVDVIIKFTICKFH